jgi:hypothetical protein
VTVALKAHTTQINRYIAKQNKTNLRLPRFVVIWEEVGIHVE